MSCHGTLPFVEKYVANLFRIILASTSGVHGMLQMGSKYIILFCSCHHIPGKICPCSFSKSNIPFGENLEEGVSLLLKFVCNTTHVKVIFITFSGSSNIGSFITRNTEEIIPNAFSTRWHEWASFSCDSSTL